MEPSSRIKVALCITELEPGGAERAMVELATRLDRQRWEPTVYVLSSEPAAPRDRLVGRLREAGIPVHFLGATGVLSVFRTLRRLWQALRREPPTIVQSFLFHADVIATVAARLAGIVNIYIGVRVAERRYPWRLRLERRMMRWWVRRCVCVSRGVADFSISNGFPADHVVVIPNGIEPLAPGEPASTDGSVRSGRLTAIGRLTAQKGFDWLLNAFAELRRRRPEVSLQIIGSGELEPELRHRAAQLGLVVTPENHPGNDTNGVPDAVQFTGWSENVASVLCEETDLFVLTSRWEGMPNVVLEAMNHALPIVATDVEGVCELLGDAENGSIGGSADMNKSESVNGSANSPQIVTFGDTMEWVQKCMAILDDPVFAQRLGQRNRKQVVADFSIDAMVRRYESLWESLM